MLGLCLGVKSAELATSWMVLSACLRSPRDGTGVGGLTRSNCDIVVDCDAAKDWYESATDGVCGFAYLP